MKNRLKVLNLEDDASDAELNSAMLSARWPACELVRVDNEKAFFSALQTGDYDLILSDFTIPGFDGMEALALARRKRPEIPFLFVSGTIGEDTAIEALKNGATDYVLKHRLMRLIPAVDRALKEARERTERQKAEAARQLSEHKYRELFESLGDAAFLTDEQTGKIVDANRRAEATLGCARLMIVGRHQSEFLVLERAGRRSLAREPAVPMCQLIRQDGTSLPVAVHTSQFMLHGRTLVLNFCHDLTGRERAQ